MQRPVLPLLDFSLDLGFFYSIWGSWVYIENMFFNSGQIFEIYAVFLYFPFKITIIS